MIVADNMHIKEYEAMHNKAPMLNHVRMLCISIQEMLIHNILTVQRPFFQGFELGTTLVHN